jgi:hypothetical protein
VDTVKVVMEDALGNGYPLLYAVGGRATSAKGPVAGDTVHLIAVAGDNIYNTPSNAGMKTFEVTAIADTGGETTDWSLQSDEWNKASLGHESQLFFGALFTFFGVQKESLGDNPSVLGGSGPKYAYTTTNPTTAIIHSQQSSSAAPSPRAYYQSVRVRSFVFALGGNDGEGPIDRIDRGY